MIVFGSALVEQPLEPLFFTVASRLSKLTKVAENVGAQERWPAQTLQPGEHRNTEYFCARGFFNVRK